MLLTIEQNSSNTEIIIASISAFISLLAFIFSLISFLKSNSLAKVEYEYSNFAIIMNTKDKILEISNKIIPLRVKEKFQPLDQTEIETLKYYLAVFDTALENNLNAYDEACSKYLANNVNQNRFENSYKNEIIGLVEGEEYASFLDDQSVKYGNIKKAFNKLTNTNHFRTEF